MGVGPDAGLLVGFWKVSDGLHMRRSWQQLTCCLSPVQGSEEVAWPPQRPNLVASLRVG